MAAVRVIFIIKRDNNYFHAMSLLSVNFTIIEVVSFIGRKGIVTII